MPKKKERDARWTPQGVAGTPRRFAVGDSVRCNAGTGWWKRGTVVQLDYLEDEEDWPAGRVAPYQIELENGDLIYAPEDSDRLIRAAVLSCGNAACGKALAPPLLQCSSCKAEAYCDKACQVGPAAAYEERVARAPASARSPLSYPYRPCPAARRPSRGRPDTSTCAARQGRAQQPRRSSAPRGKAQKRRPRAPRAHWQG